MSVSVQFLFDFGSPNAYFCHKVIPQVEARTGVKFEYVPILLGGLFKITGNRSPAEAFAGIVNKQAYNKLEVDRFVAKHGLAKYRFNPHFPVNTLKIISHAIGWTDGPSSGSGVVGWVLVEPVTVRQAQGSLGGFWWSRWPFVRLRGRWVGLGGAGGPSSGSGVVG